MKKKLWTLAALAGVCACFMLACALCPSVAEFWHRNVMGRMANALSRVSTRLSFPLMEVLAIGGAFWVALGLIWALMRRHRWRNLKNWLGNTAILGMILILGYALLWYPAYFAPGAWPYVIAEEVSQEEIVGLCRALIGELNDSAPEEDRLHALMETAWSGIAALEELPGGGNVPAKAARYPEWMRLAKISGIYIPHTAEALVNPKMEPVAAAFTICHELSHRAGIADEGQANVAAYRACMKLGGTFAYSARLWALKYAMAELHSRDEASWWQTLDQMRDGVRVQFAVAVGGYASPEQQDGWLEKMAGMLGIQRAVDSYSQLTNYLASGGGGFFLDLRNFS